MAQTRTKWHSVVRPLISGCFQVLNPITVRLIDIYRGISYGPEDDHSFMILMCRQLPRPRTIRRLWDMSLKLRRGGIKAVAPSHAARVAVMALEKIFAFPNECARRGCTKNSKARCARCQSGYCDAECQKRYISCRRQQFTWMRNLTYHLFAPETGKTTRWSVV